MDDIAMPSDFFNPNICILCLESNDTSYVNIFSTEGKQLGMEGIIVKYFWLQPNEGNNKTRSICFKCWNSVYSFHEFYLQVEHAHKILDEKMTAVYWEGTTVDPIGDNVCIRGESCQGSEEEDAIINKSKQGRQRTKKLSNTLEYQVNSVGANKTTKVKSENIVLGLEDLNELTSRVPYAAALNNGELESEIEVIQELIPIVKRRSGRLQTRKQHTSRFLTEELKSTKDPLQESDAVKENENKIKCDESHLDISDKIAEGECIRKKSRKDKSEYLVQSDKRDEYITTNFHLTCPLCHIELPKFNVLLKHFRCEHNSRGYAICCNRKFYKRCHLIDHIKLHQNPQIFKCPRCNKILGERNTYELHMKRHEEKRDRKYQCNICSKNYFSKVIYMRHILVHAPEEQKIIPCPECEKRFATEMLKDRHYKTVHLNLYAKFCEVCGKSIRGKDAFQRHMDEHSGIAQPTCQCETCGARFASRYKLKKHIKRMHSEESQTPQRCKICGKVTPGLPALHYHMNSIHWQQRKHACTFCDKTFKQSTSLKEHMTTHTGEVLYTCTYCPKTFNSNANMYTHHKRVHRKEWEEDRLQKYPKFQTSDSEQRSETTLSFTDNCTTSLKLS